MGDQWVSIDTAELYATDAKSAARNLKYGLANSLRRFRAGQARQGLAPNPHLKLPLILARPRRKKRPGRCVFFGWNLHAIWSDIFRQIKCGVNIP